MYEWTACFLWPVQDELLPPARWPGIITPCVPNARSNWQRTNEWMNCDLTCVIFSPFLHRAPPPKLSEAPWDGSKTSSLFYINWPFLWSFSLRFILLTDCCYIHIHMIYSVYAQNDLCCLCICLLDNTRSASKLLPHTRGPGVGVPASP